MENVPDKAKFECAQMPEVLAEVFSEENMSHIAQDVRARLLSAIARIEGSNDKEMTCIAKKDFPRVTHVVNKAVNTGVITSGLVYDSYVLAVQKWLRGSLRSMNKHCDECLKEGCERRAKLTREQIKAASRPGAPISSRGSKIRSVIPEEMTSV